MTSSEIFAAIPPPLASDVLEFNHANERGVYRAAIESVAQIRKVRPVFIERLPRAEQHAYLLGCLGRAQFNLAADALLRVWLLKKHSAILIDFLNSLSIPHEHGAVEALPKTVDDAALKNAVETLLAKHPRDIVVIYLASFNSTNVENWTNLDALIKEDPRLQLNRPAM